MRIAFFIFRRFVKSGSRLLWIIKFTFLNQKEDEILYFHFDEEKQQQQQHFWISVLVNWQTYLLDSTFQVVHLKYTNLFETQIFREKWKKKLENLCQ